MSIFLTSARRFNQAAWEHVAPDYFGHSALPNWGPYRAGSQYRDLIGPIRGRTFLEVGCGSGHSLNYLLKRGARHVYGLDFSLAQLTFAATVNERFIVDRRLTLLHQPMEKKIVIPSVDTAFGIFSIGWSPNIRQTLKNIYASLKPGGRFVFSWEHAMFQHVEYDRRLVVVSSYYQESVIKKNWKGHYPIHIQFPTTATWLAMLQETGFTVTRYLEPESLAFDQQSFDRSKHFSKLKALHVPMVALFECRK